MEGIGMLFVWLSVGVSLAGGMLFLFFIGLVAVLMVALILGAAYQTLIMWAVSDYVKGRVIQTMARLGPISTEEMQEQLEHLDPAWVRSQYPAYLMDLTD